MATPPRPLRRRTVLRTVAVAALLVLGPQCGGPEDGAPGAGGGRGPRPNLVFVLIDTLRADHLGVYGYERETSPNIDALAGRGYVFDEVRSVCNWTNPTIVSLFTGHYPQAVFEPAQHRRAIELVLPDEEITLAESLKARGYRTVGLVDHPGINARRGYTQGFDRYTMLYLEGAVDGQWTNTDADYVLGEVERCFEEAGDGPFFLYLHLVYPHAPYDAPEPYAEMFGPPHERIGEDQLEGMVNAYDAEIRYTDELIGDLYRRMEERGLDDDTWLVLTSDHGEGFWEHDSYEHGFYFYDEVLHVPLILVPPGGLESPRRIPTRVSNIDVFPTLLELAGVEPEAAADGSSLTRLFRGDPPEEEPVPLFMQSPRGNDIEAMAVVRDGYKYVEFPTLPGHPRELYDLDADPEEQNDLSDELQRRAASYHLTLEEHRGEVEARRAVLGVEEAEADEDVVDKLRALGYTDDE